MMSSSSTIVEPTIPISGNDRKRLPPVPSFPQSSFQDPSTQQKNRFQPGSLFAADEREQERIQLLIEFIDSQQSFSDGLEYREKVRMLLRRRETRLVVNINDIRSFNEQLCHGLLMTPLEFMPAFEQALKRIIDSMMVTEPELVFRNVDHFNLDETEMNLAKVVFRIGLDGYFGEFQTDPRHLSANTLSQMVSIDGIVTSCFLVRPKLARSVHYSEQKGTFLSREYRDALSGGTSFLSSGLLTQNSYPTQDAEGNRLETEYGLCTWRDYQKIVLQEMPERAPPGQLPRSIEVILGEDLVDQVKPGDRVRVIGINKGICSSSLQNNTSFPSHFKSAIIANSIRRIGRGESGSNSTSVLLTDLDIQNIKAIAKRSDLFPLLSRSLAPSIYGQLQVKKALLLMLLGGVEKIIGNANTNTHIRGDINILLVGDPSTAKSQMLRFVLGIAPLAIATTGRGSTGVGLTAAVTTDKETGERRLEAGAMVLADRGVVCIDEFDKMSDSDRVAIHEVMEQQTVTIAKAGIHTSLNARCSVLAASNPIHSQYREESGPRENIRLPDSLLSRFDLLFILLDKSNERLDRKLSQHVLLLHAHSENYQENDNDEREEIHESPFVKGSTKISNLDRLDNTKVMESELEQSEMNLVSDHTNLNKEQMQQEEILSVSFVKKFIHYAKARIRPVLTMEAIEAIKAMYLAFRSKSENSLEEKTLPVTPRTLETLIRLSCAHAKARLSSIVEEQDTFVAEELVRYSLYKEVLTKSRISKRNKKASEAIDIANTRIRKSNEFQAHGKLSNDQTIDENFDTTSKVEDIFGFTEEPPTTTLSSTIGVEVPFVTSVVPSNEDILTIKSALIHIRSQNDSFVMLETLLNHLKTDESEPISIETISAVLVQMENSNQLMFRDGIIFFI